MNQQVAGPPWIGLATVDCPACRQVIAFDFESQVTVIHEASRSTQSAWSIGVSCPSCHARIVTRVSLTSGKTIPTVDIVGFTEAKAPKR